MDPDQTAHGSYCLLPYFNAADIISRQHFQDKNDSGIRKILKVFLKFCRFFLACRLFQIKHFQKNLSAILSECQKV